MFSYPLSSPTMAQPQTQQRETHESCLSCEHFKISDDEIACSLDPWLMEREILANGEVSFTACEYHSDRIAA